MSTASFAQRLSVTGALRPLGAKNRSPVRIGFVTPLSGLEGEWGQQGIDGCRIWADGINASGGLMVAGRRHLVEIVTHDSATGPEATLTAARDMVERLKVRLILTLGGESFAPVLPYLMSRRVLVSTLLPTDLSPDTPFMIAPAEVHPLFAVTGVEWLNKVAPAARKVALCSQNDRLGLPSLAVYRAALEATEHEIVKEVRYAPDNENAAEIVRVMMAEDPDILCWCSASPPMMHALTEAAYKQGFTGEILAATADDYPRMLARTSTDFMSRYTFHFPDFDDPKLADTAFFFRRPKEFFDRYNQLFPGKWNAVSWEYASVLDLWHNAVEVADTIDPISVLAAMKQRQEMQHAFGPARWYGTPLFGVDNALVGDWPVVKIKEGRARIVAFGSVLSWLETHEDLLKTHMSDLGQMWYQRVNPVAPEVNLPA